MTDTTQPGGWRAALGAVARGIMQALAAGVQPQGQPASPIAAPAPSAPQSAAAAAPSPLLPPPGTTERDLDLSARTVWGEARGELPPGRVAVAAVIVTRARLAREYLARNPGKKRHPLFGDGTLAGAAQANPEARYKQFSCWNLDDPNRAKMLAISTDDPLYRECRAAVLTALKLAGTDDAPAKGATHYYDPRVVTPSWAKGARQVAEIGHHLFFDRVP